MRRLRAFGALALAALPGLGRACQTCKQALAESAEGLGFARGIYWSILLLLGLVFGLVFIFVRHIQGLDQKRSGSNP